MRNEHTFRSDIQFLMTVETLGTTGVAQMKSFAGKALMHVIAIRPLHTFSLHVKRTEEWHLLLILGILVDLDDGLWAGIFSAFYPIVVLQFYRVLQK